MAEEKKAEKPKKAPKEKAEKAVKAEKQHHEAADAHAEKEAHKAHPKHVKHHADGPKTIKFQDYTICRKRSGRYEVLAANGKNVNGADKSKILIDAKLVSAGTPKAAEPKTETPPAAN